MKHVIYTYVYLDFSTYMCVLRKFKHFEYLLTIIERCFAFAFKLLLSSISVKNFLIDSDWYWHHNDWDKKQIIHSLVHLCYFACSMWVSNFISYISMHNCWALMPKILFTVWTQTPSHSRAWDIVAGLNNFKLIYWAMIGWNYLNKYANWNG